jgi:hypothetical protein
VLGGAIALVVALVVIVGFAVSGGQPDRAAGVGDDEPTTTGPTAEPPPTEPTPSPTEDPTEDDPFDDPILPTFPSAPFTSIELSWFADGIGPMTLRCAAVRPGEYPIHDELPDAELVRCEAPYPKMFMRKRTRAQLAAERNLLLGEAAPGSLREVSGGPAAAFDRVAAYQHAGGDQTARVYWESAKCRCIGIIQAPNADVERAVSEWERTAGRSSWVRAQQ